MGKTSIKSSTVVPHALYQFPAVRDRRTKSHSTWTDRLVFHGKDNSVSFAEICITEMCRVGCSVSQATSLAQPFENAYKCNGDYNGHKIKRKKCSYNETTHQEVCIRDKTMEEGRNNSPKMLTSNGMFQPNVCVIDSVISPPENNIRGYVLVPARKLEELNRIETLLENEKAALRAKGVQAIASGSTELSARVPTEDLWLGVEEVCHCEMLFASRHFNSLNEKLREEYRSCKTGFEQRDGVVNRKKHNTTAILRAKEVALLPLSNRAARWRAMLARDTTAAQEKERCLMGLEDALQACLDKHREAEDRLHDYALYYRLAISFRALSEEDFRQTNRPGDALKLQLDFSSEIIQHMWRRRWPEVWRKRVKFIVRMQSHVRRGQAMKRWRPIIRARLLIGARSVMKECFSLWRTKTQTLKWIKERLGGERRALLQYVMKCWKSLIKERKKRRQIIIERVGRHWHAQLPFIKVWRSWLDHHVRCQNLKGAHGRALCMNLFTVWSTYTKNTIEVKRAIVHLAILQSRWRGYCQRRKWKAIQVIRHHVRRLVRISRIRRCVKDFLLHARKSAVEDYILRRKGEDQAAMAAEEIERVSKLQRLVDNAESNAQTSFLEKFQTTKKRRRSERFFTWLIRKSDDYYMPAHAKEIIAKEMNNIKTEQMHLSRKNRDMHLLRSKSQMLHEAKHRLMCKAMHIAKIQTIHDFNAKRPAQYMCCDPSCKRTFGAEDTYRAHWKRNPHADGGTPSSGIVDIHLLLIDPKGRHAAQSFLAMCGEVESINSIIFWEGVESWRKHLSTSPEFEMTAKMLYRRFLAPGALSRTLQACSGDMTCKDKDENQFLDVDSTISSPEYLVAHQWVALCTIQKALGQEFWVSEAYRHYKEQAHKVKNDEEKRISERLNFERQEELKKFARNFKYSILEEKKKRKDIVAERLTDKVVGLACENILVSALEGAAAVVEMEKEGEGKRKALCEVMAEACIWKCAGLVADSCVSWWTYEEQVRIEEARQFAIYKKGEDICWYNSDETYYHDTQRVLER